MKPLPAPMRASEPAPAWISPAKTHVEPDLRTAAPQARPPALGRTAPVEGPLAGAAPQKPDACTYPGEIAKGDSQAQPFPTRAAIPTARTVAPAVSPSLRATALAGHTIQKNCAIPTAWSGSPGPVIEPVSVPAKPLLLSGSTHTDAAAPWDRFPGPDLLRTEPATEASAAGVAEPRGADLDPIEWACDRLWELPACPATPPVVLAPLGAGIEPLPLASGVSPVLSPRSGGLESISSLPSPHRPSLAASPVPAAGWSPHRAGLRKLAAPGAASGSSILKGAFPADRFTISALKDLAHGEQPQPGPACSLSSARPVSLPRHVAITRPSAPAAMQLASAPVVVAASLPRLRAGGDGFAAAGDAGSMPMALDAAATALIRAENRPLAWRTAVRLDGLTEEFPPAVCFEEVSAASVGQSPAKTESRLPSAPGSAPLGGMASIPVAPPLIRPAEITSARLLKVSGRFASGIFIPQLRLGPLRPRIMCGAQLREPLDSLPPKSRRGAVIPISDLRVGAPRESGEPSRVRGAGSGKSHR